MSRTRRRAQPAHLERNRHIFAQFMNGRSVGAIASGEGLGARRVQQIIAAELERQGSDPADDYVLLQVARLERALELLGGEIEAGKTAAVPGYLSVIAALGKLVGSRMHLSGTGLRTDADVERMIERFERLDAARETLADSAAKPKALQPVENTGNHERFREPERNSAAICETPAKPKRNATQSSAAERNVSEADRARRADPA